VEEAVSIDTNPNWYAIGPLVAADSFKSFWKLAANYTFTMFEKFGLVTFKLGLIILAISYFFENGGYDPMASLEDGFALFSSLFAIGFFKIFTHYCWSSVM